MTKPKMTLHIDYQALPNCKNPEESYGEICVKCNQCGRFTFKPILITISAFEKISAVSIGVRQFKVRNLLDLEKAVDFYRSLLIKENTFVINTRKEKKDGGKK